MKASLEGKKTAVEEARGAYAANVVAAEAEVNAARGHLENVQRRLAADAQLLGRAVEEANRLREPGGPLCSWQRTPR